jgi:hypothetical protein
LRLRLSKLISSTPTVSDTICDCGVMGRMKASVSEKEERGLGGSAVRTTSGYVPNKKMISRAAGCSARVSAAI